MIDIPAGRVIAVKPDVTTGALHVRFRCDPRAEKTEMFTMPADITRDAEWPIPCAYGAPGRRHTLTAPHPAELLLARLDAETGWWSL